MAVEPDGMDDQAMRDRLDKLGRDLSSRTQSQAPQAPQGVQGPGNLGSAMSLGFRVMSEFVAAVVVGALVGWQLDRWLGTTPAFLLILCGLGTAAGFWNVYRIAMRGTGLTGPR